MKFLFDDSPIIACSTSMASNGAMGIIRISGFESLLSFQKCFGCDLSKVNERVAVYTSLIFDEIVVDEVVLIFFRGPRSYNGENILEITAHGNVLNLQHIIDCFTLEYPIRLADGGEFTYRALKNKKLSLSQVEGLDLLLNANNPYVLEQGKDILFGELNASFLKLHHLFTNLKSSVEIFIDFLDDVGETEANDFFQKTLSSVNLQIESLYRRSQIPIGGLFSPEVVIAGETNAGKSSLFNFLLGKMRAIIADTPGTTRDFISEAIHIEGVPFQLIDTAGMRNETNDSIEREGMALGKDLLAHSFFKVLVINPNLSTHITEELLTHYSFDLLLITHFDQKERLPDYQQLLSKYSPLQFKGDSKIPCVYLSLKNFNYFIEERELNRVSLFGPIGPARLKEELFQLIFQKYQRIIQDRPILLTRHRELIAKIHAMCKTFTQQYGRNEQENSGYIGDVAIMDHQLKEIETHLSQLIGIVHSKDVLNNVFDNFCIGK